MNRKKFKLNYYLIEILLRHLIRTYSHKWDGNNRIFFVDVGDIIFHDRVLTVTGKKLLEFFDNIGMEAIK